MLMHNKESPVAGEKLFDLEEDGSILCETRDDCPDDIPNKVGPS